MEKTRVIYRHKEENILDWSGENMDNAGRERGKQIDREREREKERERERKR